MTRSVEIPDKAVLQALAQIPRMRRVTIGEMREALEVALPYLAPAAPLLPVCTNCESEAWTCAGCGVIADITQAPAVPQPVDRQAIERVLRKRMQNSDFTAIKHEPVRTQYIDSWVEVFADAVMAVLVGEQEQVEK